MDIEQRVDAADADRRRHRTLISAAAAVVLVILVAGGIALTDRDSDDSQQVDTADSTTFTSTSAAETTTTSGQPTTSTTDEEVAPPEPSDTTGTTGTTGTTDAEPPGVQPISAQTQVRIDGIGPISVPVTVADAAVATGQDVRIDPNSRIEDSSPCGFAQIDGLDELWFMVDGDRIVRVDVGEASPLRTDAGVGVGSTTAEVLAAYPGQVTEEPHPYPMDDDSRYLVVTDSVYPGDEIIFSVHQGAVADYRAGLAEFVRYPEGCA